MGKDEDERDEEKTTACRGKQIGGHRHTARLREHVACHDHTVERQRAELPAQGDNTHGNHLCVVAKDADEMIAEEPADNRANDEEGRAHSDREPIRALQTRDETGTEAKTTKRLKALPQADDNAP